MTVEELLASDVGRRMVEAVNAVMHGGDTTHYADCPECNEAVAASLRVALDTTCPTCGGRGEVLPAMRGTRKLTPCSNPDCKDGKVPPALTITQCAT